MVFGATVMTTRGPGVVLDAECAAADVRVGRADTKAWLLLAFDGAVLAGIVSVADPVVPLPAQVVGGAAVLALAWRALLLLVVRLGLGGWAGGAGREGFVVWARFDDDAVYAAMGEDTGIARVRVLSVLVVGKFRRLVHAVGMILAGLGLVLAAAVLAVVCWPVGPCCPRHPSRGRQGPTGQPDHLDDLESRRTAAVRHPLRVHTV